MRSTGARSSDTSPLRRTRVGVVLAAADWTAAPTALAQMEGRAGAAAAQASSSVVEPVLMALHWATSQGEEGVAMVEVAAAEAENAASASVCRS